MSVIEASRPKRGRPERRPAARARARPAGAPAPGGARKQKPDVEALAVRWQCALDAAENALGPASSSLPLAEIARRRQALTLERRETADLLVRLARVAGVEPRPWLSPVRLVPQMLGLRPGIRACLFDLEGVLTDGAQLHAWAWTIVFDDFLARLSERTGWRFVPFGEEDYRAYFDGRPRLDAIHAFLASRGIRLPEGGPHDADDADTTNGLAMRKGEVLAGGLRPRGVTALPAARRYLQAVGLAGIKRGVISASSHTLAMLDVTDLTPLVDVRVDAAVIREEHLRSLPAPDLLVAACHRLGVAPGDALSFTDSVAAVAAGREAGLTVIGVGEGNQSALLQAAGAERVVPSLGDLLDARLREP